MPLASPVEMLAEEKRIDELGWAMARYACRVVSWGEAQQLWAAGKKIKDLAQRAMYYSHVVKQIERMIMGLPLDNSQIEEVIKWRWKPVDVRTFICDPYYLNKKEEIYPKVLEELVEINSGKYVEVVFTGGIGSAKCLGKDTPVIMFDGTTKKVQDVVVGDLLMGPDSKPRTVISLASGVDDLYRVDQKVGDSYVVNKAHILSLQYTDTSNGSKGPRYGKVKGDVENISVTEYLHLSDKQRGLLKGWRPAGVEFEESYVSDPYLLGLWLGDGTSECTSFTSMDQEIADYLQSIAQRDGLRLHVTEDKRGNKAKRYALSGDGNNRVRTWLQSYGLLNNKHVPHQFLTASREDRLKLLAGLIDTDGSLNGNGYVISQKRKVLADGIAFLARSLGYAVTMRVEPHENGSTYYRCFINGDVCEVPVLLPRKKASVRKQAKCVHRHGITVTPIGQGEYFGFELEGPDRLFLLGDFTVTHNTTSALYTCAYQLYLVSCMAEPHRVFKQDSAAEMLFIFQSINAKLAKGVDFNRFKSMLEGSQYFKDKYPFDKNVESKLVFPRRLEVVPVSGSDTAAIGQNVIGGLIDELNYMAVVEKSKQSADSGTYDQAVALYNSIARRRKSRFMQQGKLPGILCLVSSKKYPGQFTDVKEEEAKTDPTIYIYDKRVWDVKPDGTFTAGWFYVFVGDLARKPRVLAENEVVDEKDRHLVVRVPNEFREEFRKDIINGLREIAGISTLARHPYFLETEKVSRCMKKEHLSIFSTNKTDFVTSKLAIRKSAIYKPELPRFAHIDLAISGDSAGVVIGTVTGFKSMQQLGVNGNDLEMMPIIRIDGTLEVKPPQGAEIQFWKIREILVLLRKLGMNMRWVTFDSFQSTDSQQLLRQQGFVTGMQSMDVVPCKPYDFLKSAMYDGRVELPRHEHLLTEILSLERDMKTGKIDHPPNMSKDVADALAGVVYGLTMRREIWGLYKVPTICMPNALRISKDKLEEKNEHLTQAQGHQTDEVVHV